MGSPKIKIKKERKKEKPVDNKQFIEDVEANQNISMKKASRQEEIIYNSTF